MESLKDLLSPKTVNKFSFIANGFWLVLGVVLSSVFMAMETNEPRFPCDAKDDHQELIQGSSKASATNNTKSATTNLVFQYTLL